jgi:predicted MPP superfamily phosphohydrolase
MGGSSRIDGILTQFAKITLQAENVPRSCSLYRRGYDCFSCFEPFSKRYPAACSKGCSKKTGELMNFMIFACSYTLVMTAFGSYISRRWFWQARPGRKTRVGVALAIVAIMWLPIFSIILRRYDVGGVGVAVLAWTGYLGAGYLSFLFTILLLRDAGLVMMALFRRLRKPAPAVVPLQISRIDESRRRFLAYSMNGGVSTAAMLFTGYGVAEARDVPGVKEVALAFKNLPAELEGFRIVQITDIHVSPTVKRPYVAGIVKKVNRLNADLVALTGDLVDGSVRRLSGDVEPLGEIQSRHGNFFVTGNHEYYSGAPEWMRKVESLGFTVLTNAHRVIDHGGRKIVLGGVTDYRAGRFYGSHRSDPQKALRGAPDADLKILLAHQPKNIFEAAKAGYDLQISGHTHGGQFFPWNFMVHFFQPYVAGLHQHKNTRIYISRGTGYWGPPLRLGSPSEITLLRLVSG